MNILNIISIIGSFILFVMLLIYISQNNKLKKEKEKEKENFLHAMSQACQDTITYKEIHDKLLETQDILHFLSIKKQEIEKQIKEKSSFNENLKKMREEELDRLMEEKKSQKELTLAREISEWVESAQEAASFNFQLESEELDKELEDKSNELIEIKAIINDFQEKRDAINKEILRARAIEEDQDFYRIQLDEITSRDIHTLNSIRPQLSKIDNFDKFVYDIYVKKSVDEMIKRVLEGRTPCGIYKITRLKTGEIYIGQSTDIKSRWQQHTKSAFHCGTISHSILHTTMERDGIDHFTFELIEECEKAKLREREKFWTEIYGSKDYGLNERVG